MTRIATVTHCDLSGCEHSIDGPTKENGWTIWNGKDLCPQHNVTSLPQVSFADYPTNPELRTLYDSQYYIGNPDAERIVFRTVRWCVAHDSNGQGPGLDGMACHYSALYQATLPSIPGACEFVDKLIEV